MVLKLNGTEYYSEANETWADLLSRTDFNQKEILGVSISGRTVPLNAPVEEYVYAHTLTLNDEEGRRIYERSLQLLFLAALNRLFPGTDARIEHSFGHGLYIVPNQLPISEGILKTIEAQMTKLVKADAPISSRCVSTQDAMRETDQKERLRLLKYRRAEHFKLYDLDGCSDYFYGEMVPSAGYIPVFSLRPYAQGLILMMPDPHNPGEPAPFRDLPQLMRTYTEAARWQSILNCANVADLNEMTEEKKLREFIRVNEALQEKRVEEIAEAFIQSGARLMLIAGPSSSGKTTFSHRLSIALRVHGLKPVKLSLDDYYRDRDTLPREEDGSIDLERLDTLDIDLLCRHLPTLLDGRPIEAPLFDFTTGRRRTETQTIQVGKDQPIIIEGIHGLNDALTASVPRELKYKIYISALTMLNLDDHNRIRTTDARLLRRIVRDNLFRGTLPEETMAMWPSVRRGEERYIFPYQEEADAMFNSSLCYELAVMKKYAYPLLRAVQPSSPYYTLARRLVKFLNYIKPADVEDEIPVNSILREFIGGCCFYREED